MFEFNAALYGSILIVMLLLDSVWLYFNYDYHFNLFSNIQGSPMQVRLIPALIVYFVMGLSLYYFVLRKTKDIKQGAQDGALLGFFIYSVYDFTNLATLKNYTVHMAIRDTAWGSALFGTTAALVNYLRS